jgi:TfoX/Sxy family transcriptional regulator of competence genes
MNNSLCSHLSELVEEAASSLPAVAKKRMFGCDAWFANENIFALVWKDGRIGVKLPVDVEFERLMGMPGSNTWSPGAMKSMNHWVLTPESFHDDAEELAAWVKKAHASAMVAEKKPAKKKTTAARKTPTKKG